MAKRIPKYRPDPGFPRELLQNPIENRLDYFDKLMVRHPYFRAALLKMLRLVIRTKPYFLLFLIGPTGVGKSELLEQLKQLLFGVLRNKLRKDLSMLPWVAIIAREPKIGNYNWNAHDRDILVAMNDKLIKYKLPMPIEEWQKTHKSKVPPLNALGKDFQFPAEEALRERKVHVLVIDEGQEIAKITSHRKLEDQVQFLKTRGKTTNVRQLLAGTYELNILCNLNGQLSRISREVYFPAYQKTAEGFETFVKIVVRLQRHLPLEIMPDLKKESEYLFEGSLGRVGILKDWLCDTLADVLDRGGKTITKADLKRNALSEGKLNELRAEVKGTDSEYLEDLSSEAAEPAEQHEDGTPDKEKEAARVNSATTAKKKGGQRRRIGDRNPTRDPVGNRE